MKATPAPESSVLQAGTGFVAVYDLPPVGGGSYPGVGGARAVSCEAVSIVGRTVLEEELYPEGNRRVGGAGTFAPVPWWFFVRFGEPDAETGWIQVFFDNYRVDPGRGDTRRLIREEELRSLQVVDPALDASGVPDLVIAGVQGENLSGSPCGGPGEVQTGTYLIRLVNRGTGPTPPQFEVETTAPGADPERLTVRLVRGILPGEEVMLFNVVGGTRLVLDPDNPNNEHTAAKVAVVGQGSTFVCQTP